MDDEQYNLLVDKCLDLLDNLEEALTNKNNANPLAKLKKIIPELIAAKERRVNIIKAFVTIFNKVTSNSEILTNV